jgi:asparaginyl-tRNA synthetase
MTKALNSHVSLRAWVEARPRCLGKICFLDIVDSTGSIQVVVEMNRLSTPSDWMIIRSLYPETSVTIHGIIAARKVDTRNSTKIEIRATSIDVISMACRTITPPIRRGDLAVLATNNSDKILSNRHLYLRNPILLNIGKLRSEMLHSIRQWFHSHSFVDFSAPLITTSTLYEPNSAITLGNLGDGDKAIFLSQCSGFYLEAAAHAHERVYNLAPSFRNESRTNRHLMEYWHIKAELASGTLDSVISLVEIFLKDILDDCQPFGTFTASLLGNIFPACLELPFHRITYIEAQHYLSNMDQSVKFGQNISSNHERMLTDHFCKIGQSPLWITHKPRLLEPFPYAIHPTDSRLTMTADLIAPNGYGEICGVAEKSYRLHDLDERLNEKGKIADDEYQWVRDMRNFGMVPHVAFGMGLERMIRWWIGVRHVKDTIPFPRVFGRRPVP